MSLPTASSLLIGHQWLKPLIGLIDKIVAVVNGLTGAAWDPVTAMTAAALPANTYSSVTLKKTASANGTLTVDDILLEVGDTFWDKDAGTGSQRGKFTVIDAGSASSPWIAQRSPDADASGDFTQGKEISVEFGTANANKNFSLTNATFTLDVTTPALLEDTGGVTLTTDQTISGAKSFSASALRVWNGAATFASRFTSAATATRLVNLPDAAGDVILDAATQTISGAKKFTTLLLQVFNAGATFVTKFASNATADRTVTFPDADATMAQAGVASGATAPAFTSALTGTGLTAVGQVLTTTDTHSVTANQYAGCWLVSRTGNVVMIVSHPASAGAVVVFTVIGKATTDAGVYDVLTQSHTHAQT